MRFPAVMEKFWKSLKIWQSYRQFKGENFFRRHSVGQVRRSRSRVKVRVRILVEVGKLVTAPKLTRAQQLLRWATVWPQQIWVKKWGASVPLSMGELGPYLTQCCLGRGLPPYQVEPWSIQPFGQNRHGLKSVGNCCVIFFWGGGESWSNTMSPGSSPTFIPSDIFIHLPVWP